jgi:hypothetical protein
MTCITVQAVAAAHIEHSITTCEECIMSVNIGKSDRLLRITAGLVLMALAATGTVGAWGYVGIVPLLTGLFRFCPAYTLLGMNTCGLSKD